MRDDRITPRQWASARLERLEDRLEDLSISRIIPSALTLLGLCAGATSIRFALTGDWRLAVVAIFCAMLFDMMDGRAARLLGADSRFGVQLDSLADLVSFGVAPAVLVYTWSLSQMGGAGWIAALIFCACSALRLARFNIEASRDEGASQSHPYFTGLPTPAAACIMLLPLLLNFEFATDFVRMPAISLSLVGITSVLMVSRVPTPSLKYVKLDQHAKLAAWILGLALIPAMVFVPWTTLLFGLAVYIGAIPFGIHAANEEEAEEQLTK